jgi:hypothetical protein
MLPSLTRDESTSYITRRLAWAGANVSDVFARDALAAICEASDGVPRCLHQLADHCLTLATNRTEKPINLRTVREALDHLKQLPLTWAEPTTGRGTTNPLEAARAQAIARANASIELDGPVARNSNASSKSNTELFEGAVFDTYPLQSEPSETDGVLELQTPSSTWDLDSLPELANPWLDADSFPRADEVVELCESPVDDVDNEWEPFGIVQPAQLATADLDFAETLEVGNSEELEANAAFKNIPEAPNNNRENNAEPKHLAVPPRVADQTVDATALPEVELPQPAATTAVMDEEVVIDRYAALDSALNRLTRTMLNVRANARRKAAESVVEPVTPSATPIPVEILDSVHQQFDVVLPEDDCADEPSRLKSGTHSSIHSAASLPSAQGRILETVAGPVTSPSAVSVAPPLATGSTTRQTASRPTTDERRPYQLLFSELRRRRRKV